MAEPSNAEIMNELKSLGGQLQRIDTRLKAVEADMSVLRTAYASQGKALGDLLRSTPLPPPQPPDEDDLGEDTNPSFEIDPEDTKW
jgi:hypothetical protein